jgi:hypothetical protein
MINLAAAAPVSGGARLLFISSVSVPFSTYLRFYPIYIRLTCFSKTNPKAK